MMEMSEQLGIEAVEEMVDHYVNNEDGLQHFSEDFLKSFLICDTPDFHKEIYKLISTKSRLALAAPRSFAKSTITCVIYPLYCILFKAHKDIVIISASETLSVEWLRKIKLELSTNNPLRNFYYRIYGKFPESDKWSENHIIVSNGVNLRAKGAEAQIRGFRPDLFLCDDIESDEGVRSEDRRRNLKEWFQKAVIGTLDPQGQLVMIGTILHYLSLLSYLIEESSKFGWEVKMYQAYKNGLEEEGNELWVAKWNHKDLQLRKSEIGSFAFSSEYMNNPVPSDAAAFKEDYLKYYEELPPCSYVQVFDPAYSEDVTSDYKVSAIIAKDGNSNRYLVDYVRTHAPMGDFLNQSVNLYKRYKPQIVGTPLGNERIFASKVKEVYESNKCFPVFEELKNISSVGRSKEARIIASLQGLFQSSKYFIKSDHEEAKEELLTFPAGKHDDLLDAMSYAEQIITDTYISTEEDKTHSKTQETADRGITGYGRSE